MQANTQISAELGLNFRGHTGLKLGGGIHKNTGLVAQHFYWTRNIFTRPETKEKNFLTQLNIHWTIFILNKH